jgi:uncharacterized protein (DUF2267 family)
LPKKDADSFIEFLGSKHRKNFRLEGNGLFSINPLKLPTWRFLMKLNEFTTTVQTVADIDSKEQAEKAIRAALETLSERIVGDEASELADQLPEEIGQCLRGREGQMGERFSLHEFYQRVSQREGVDAPTAAIHARAVFATINSAVTSGEYDDMKSNLPEEYKELFAPEEA